MPATSPRNPSGVVGITTQLAFCCPELEDPNALLSCPITSHRVRLGLHLLSTVLHKGLLRLPFLTWFNGLFQDLHRSAAALRLARDAAALRLARRRRCFDSLGGCASASKPESQPQGPGSHESTPNPTRSPTVRCSPGHTLNPALGRKQWSRDYPHAKLTFTYANLRYQEGTNGQKKDVRLARLLLWQRELEPHMNWNF